MTIWRLISWQEKKRKIPAKPTILDKKQVGVSLTVDAVDSLNAIVEKTGLSKSKLIEGLVTGEIAIASSLADRTIAIEAENIDLFSGNAVPTESTTATKAATTETADSNELNEEIKKLETQLEEQISNYKALEKKSSSTIQDLEMQLKEQVAKTKEDRENQADSLNTKLTEQETIVTELQKQVADYQQQEKSWQEKLDTANQELDSKNKKYQDLQKSFTDTEKESAKIKDRLQQKIEANDSLQKDIADYESQLETIATEKKRSRTTIKCSTAIG